MKISSNCGVSVLPSSGFQSFAFAFNMAVWSLPSPFSFNLCLLTLSRATSPKEVSLWYVFFPSGIPLYLWFSCPRSPFLSHQQLPRQIRSLYFPLSLFLSYHFKYTRSLFMVGIHCMPQSFMMVLHQNSLSVRGGSENSFRLCQEFTSKMPPANSAICNKGNFGEVLRGWISLEKKLSPPALFPVVWQPRRGRSLVRF